MYVFDLFIKMVCVMNVVYGYIGKYVNSWFVLFIKYIMVIGFKFFKNNLIFFLYKLFYLI